ncbi:unnamed protein product [Phytophthora fragariaefolia]|uniref:Unnamed protein product n=1 Tax=Phytophthora fragariaefolia TaxID=1490495 RepID=A0A9W6YC49_9STRA|nr:unnamed protein product [Phytophthora fragariaefolia]
MWDFSAKNAIEPLPKATSYGYVVRSLSTLHNFAQVFYNPETVDFIMTTRDFVISYNDHAHSNLTKDSDLYNPNAATDVPSILGYNAQSLTHQTRTTLTSIKINSGPTFVSDKVYHFLTLHAYSEVKPQTTRGQTKTCLYPVAPPFSPSLESQVTSWNDVVMHGVTPRWMTSSTPFHSAQPSSCSTTVGEGSHIRRHLRVGKLEERYRIVDSRLLSLWPEVFISPIGTVDKAGDTQQDIGLVNDYTLPG